MRLSKKGQIKIGESLCIFGRSLAGSRATALAQLAFEPDDFEDCVVLTTKEAEELAAKLKANSEFFFLQTGNFDHDTDDLYWCLLEKIEQVEEGNDSSV